MLELMISQADESRQENKKEQLNRTEQKKIKKYVKIKPSTCFFGPLP